MKRTKMHLTIILLSGVLLVATCSDKSENQTIFQEESLPQLSALPVQTELIVDSEFPFALIYKYTRTREQVAAYEEAMASIPESELALAKAANTMYDLYAKYGIDKILGFKSMEEKRADFWAMRQKYITPPFPTDAHKKSFASKFLAQIDTYKQLEQFNYIVELIEQVLGMTLEEAAELKVKADPSEAKLATGVFPSYPPQNQWNEIPVSNNGLTAKVRFYSPSYWVGTQSIPYTLSLDYPLQKYVKCEWGVARDGCSVPSMLNRWVEGSPSSPAVQLSQAPVYSGSNSQSIGGALVSYIDAKLYNSPTDPWSQYIASVDFETYNYAPTKGDLDYDTDIDIFDFLACINIVSGVPPGSYYESWAADTDSDGMHNTPDFLDILNWQPWSITPGSNCHPLR